MCTSAHIHNQHTGWCPLNDGLTQLRDWRLLEIAVVAQAHAHASNADPISGSIHGGGWSISSAKAATGPAAKARGEMCGQSHSSEDDVEGKLEQMARAPT